MIENTIQVSFIIILWEYPNLISFFFLYFQTEKLYTYSAEDIDGSSFNTFKFYSNFTEKDLFFINENGELLNNTALTEKNDTYTFNIWVSFLKKIFFKHK